MQANIPPACKGSFPTCWEHLGRNPLPRLLCMSPQGLLCACLPCPACVLLQEPTLSKNSFIGNEMSVFPS